MSYVLIRHKVANYAKWKHVVQAATTWRKASGEKSFQVFRNSSAPNDLTIVCGWDSTARMRRFVESAELRERMKQAGVVGRPEIHLFSKAEDLSVV
jgi:heme-degrading monooxygenase HmoA